MWQLKTLFALVIYFPLYLEKEVCWFVQATQKPGQIGGSCGLPPVGLLAELVNDDGTVQRLPELFEFAKEHQLKIISIADLIAYRRVREQLIERSYEFEVVTKIGPAAWL